MKRFWSILLVMVGMILVDQLSKGAVQQNFHLGESIPVIDGFFNLTYVQNTGAAFGIGRGSPEWARVLFFLALPVLIVIGLFVALIKSLKGPALISWAYGLILSGAIGNLLDRFILKFVVDFFDFYIGDSHFAVFNVADSCVSVGGAFLFIDWLFFEKKRNEANPT